LTSWSSTFLMSSNVPASGTTHTFQRCSVLSTHQPLAPIYSSAHTFQRCSVLSMHQPSGTHTFFRSHIPAMLRPQHAPAFLAHNSSAHTFQRCTSLSGTHSSAHTFQQCSVLSNAPAVWHTTPLPLTLLQLCSVTSSALVQLHPDALLHR
jgi:hypothetical protein